MEFTNNSGEISLLKVYRIWHFLEYGYKENTMSTKVPKMLKDILIPKYGLQYNPNTRKYSISIETFFNQIKNDYPKKFSQLNICDYTKLCYIAL